MRKNLIIILGLFLVNSVLSQDSLRIDTKIREYIELSGGQQSFETAVDQMVEMYKSMDDSEESVSFWDSFTAEIKEESMDKLIDMLIPIYKANVTEEELDAGITYLKSPLGKSLIQKTPMIMQESMQAGMIWGQEIGLKIAEKMESMKKN